MLRDFPNSLSYFKNNGAHFIEISTEACLPEEEIKRIAGLLSDYK